MEQGRCEGGDYDGRGGQRGCGPGACILRDEEDSSHGGGGWRGKYPKDGTSGRYGGDPGNWRPIYRSWDEWKAAHEGATRSDGRDGTAATTGRSMLQVSEDGTLEE